MNAEPTKYVKRYGIMLNCHGRWAVVTDVSEDRKQYSRSEYLTYKRPETAIRKAEEFVKGLHTNNKDWLGNPICFEFVNMGIIE